MKFARYYKYRTIPYCSQCAAHTKFSTIRNSWVDSALKTDKLNAEFFPTSVEAQSGAKFVCNSCGSKMFRWADKTSEVGEYFDQFYDQQEVNQKNIEGARRISFVISLIIIITTNLAFNFFVGDYDPYLMAIAGYISIVMSLIIYVLVTPYFNDVKKRNSHNKTITVGKGLKGETVLFNQRTGRIKYT